MEWILNRHFWIVHLVLIGLLSLALASTASRLLGRRLDVERDVVKPSAGRSANTPAAKGRPRSFYSVILDRNIFQAVVKEKSPKKKASPKKSIDVEQVKNLAKTPLDIRLRGTVVREGGGSFAVIENRRTRKEDLYHVGDMILGQAKLAQVFRDRVVILRDGKREVLELAVSREKTRGRRRTAQTKRPPPRVATGVRKLGSNRWSISREELESAKANLSQLMTQVRITPNFTDGKPDGFKLLSIKRGSLLDRLGFRNGDVIRHVNGIPLDNPEKALELYGEMESGQSISVGVVRRGRERTLNYELQ